MESKQISAKEREEAKFSLSGATLYGINAVIGSGIFLLPRSIYKDLGPASILAVVAVWLLVMLLGICYAEVAGYVKENGGAFQYSKRAFGDFIGFNVGLLGWAVTIIAWSAMAAGFAKIAILTFPVLEGKNTILSTSLIVVLALMNLRGINISKIFTLSITVAKLIPIIAFSLMSIFFISNGVHKGNFTPFIQLTVGMDFWTAMSQTMLTVFYAFIGFETLSVVAGEMRNPKKNVPRAILISITIVSIFYTLIMAGTIAMLGSSIMDTNAPVQDAFVKMVGPSGFWIVSIGMFISILGLNVGESIMVPRFGASIASEGLLPSIIAKKNKHEAPVISILLCSFLAIILLLSGSFEELVELSVVFRFFQYIPTALAVIKLRKKEPETKVVFRVPFGPIIPVVSVIVGIWMCLASEPRNLVYGVVGIGVASVMYIVFRRKSI